MEPLTVHPEGEGHWPTLWTLLMIEKTIKEADIPPKRTQLWKSLPRKTMYQTFRRALEYLDASGKIMVDKDGRVVWVAAESLKLRELFDEAVKVR